MFGCIGFMLVLEIVMVEVKKIGVVGVIFFVVGNMMGLGVFLLLFSFVKIGIVLIWGWLIIMVGVLLLVFVFVKLGKLVLKVGGLYVYVCDWFGFYMGF